MKTMLFLVVVISLSLTLHANQQQPATTGEKVVNLRSLVHDPKIMENAPAPSPLRSGTLYSEWTINGSNYVIAYRNEDKGDPFDIVADIYYADPQGSRLQKLTSVPVFMQVEDVKLVRMTAAPSSQLAFYRSSGQLDWLTIVALHGPSARKLFDYGARWIKLTEDNPPKILAHSHPDDTTETFKWCASKRKIVLESACRQKH